MKNLINPTFEKKVSFVKTEPIRLRRIGFKSFLKTFPDVYTILAGYTKSPTIKGLGFGIRGEL